jgi:putative tricarboxylic transport membrane protein
MKQDKAQQPGFWGPRLAAAVLLVFGLSALYYAFQIRQGAGYSVVGTLFFPLVVVIGLVVLSLMLLLRTTILPDYDLAGQVVAEEVMTHWGTVGLTGLALVAYAFALNLLGYVVATSLFFPGVAWVLDSRQPIRDFIIGVVLSIIMYVSFTRFLGVRLPAGILAGIL